MPTRLRKVRKKRGSRSHGWGQSSGHRGAGSHGGVGKTGGHKHKWTYTVSYEPNRFGKHGFYRHNIPLQTVNVEQVAQHVRTLLTSKQAVRKDEGIFIDLEAMGVDKLLGSGKVDQPLTIRVKALSSTAARKIREAKGKILRVE